MNQKFLSHIQSIRNCPYLDYKIRPCKSQSIFPPVINQYNSRQKYMIISSDPSADTNKTKREDEPHSNFALRFLSLIFLGDDDSASCDRISHDFQHYNQLFARNFYWTHFAKCYSQGNPTSFCAKQFLYNEIDFFSPSLIICLGGKAPDLLLGKDSLKNRVNKILYYKQIPVICCLHPSRDWNINRRPKYFFYETIDLIRKHTKIDKLPPK